MCSPEQRGVVGTAEARETKKPEQCEEPRALCAGEPHRARTPPTRASCTSQRAMKCTVTAFATARTHCLKEGPNV